jgi:hypothetical protein
MIDFNDGFLYRMRAYGVRSQMNKPTSDIDAGYCLDAIDRSPAGSTQYIEPEDSTAPQAAARITWPRGIL